MADSDAHTLSIIIVTFNSLPALEGCLESLIVARGDLALQVIIVDNGSTDSSLTTVHDYFPDAQIIANGTNRGFAAACNRGAQIATGTFLCFINPDVQVDSDSLGRMVTVLLKSPQAGLVSARVRFADGRFQPTCRQFPTPSNILMSRGSVLSRLWDTHGAGKSVYTLPDYSETTVVPAVAATFAAVSRATFERIGGFDTRFFMYMEDTDLSLRLTHAGYQNLFVPFVGGVHLWWQGGKAGVWRRQLYQHVSVWRYFTKHIPNGFTIMLLPFLLVANYLVTCMAAVLTGKSR